MLSQQTNSVDPCSLLAQLEALRNTVYSDGSQIFKSWESRIQREAFVPSAKNLAYYLALRKHDLRDLQVSLRPWGLSSLGRSESHVLEQLDTVLATLRTLCHAESRHWPSPEAFFKGGYTLDANATATLGPSPKNRRVRIMVTFPSHAAEDYALVRDLMATGMNAARINCAHDDKAAWQAMIGNIRRAERELDRTCKIIMDLGGPKIRTHEMSFSKDTRFRTGDKLLVTRSTPTQSGSYLHQVSCTLPDVLDQVKVGETVWFDDGKIGTVICDIVDEGIVLEVLQARAGGERIKAEKGINFPDTDLDISPLTAKDLQDLDFVTQHADMIGYSFVQHADEVDQLQSELEKRIPDPVRWENLAIIAKIETRTAVKHLPEIIVQAAGRQNFGVMIARGDLAVEIGFDRLAEMQEEILWICEAAHVPVIWATQVLENLVKKGLPSRAEVTDAAMSQRTECVMLNKGEFILRGVQVLDNVLSRMEAHQFKKTPGLRALNSWQWLT